MTPTPTAADHPPSGERAENDEPQYRSRKPKWWTQLSGRRGTRGQRRTIERMTGRGYCMPKDVLSNFSRMSNRGAAARSRRLRDRNNVENNEGDDHDEGDDGKEDRPLHDDEWRRAWWDRSLGIIASCSNGETLRASSVCEIGNSPAGRKVEAASNEKYAHKIQQMYDYKCPLPPQNYGQVWLEVGFGNGDNLLANARNHREALFVGCEIHQPGIGTVLRRMESEIGLLVGDAVVDDDDNGGKDNEVGNNDDEGCSTPTTYKKKEERKDRLSNELEQNRNHQQKVSTPSSSALCQNVRVLPGDGIKLLSHLPSGYLDSILLTFPDPWPKECHRGWRVVQQGVVREMHRVLKGGGGEDRGGVGRVFVATDAECFDSWTRDVFRQESSPSSGCLAYEVQDGDSVPDTNSTRTAPLWREVVPCPDRKGWLPAVSHYECKGLDEGRTTMLQCWECL